MLKHAPHIAPKVLVRRRQVAIFVDRWNLQSILCPINILHKVHERSLSHNLLSTMRETRRYTASHKKLVVSLRLSVNQEITH